VKTGDLNRWLRHTIGHPTLRISGSPYQAGATMVLDEGASTPTLRVASASRG